MSVKEFTRTQMRFPDAIYLAIRHVAADTHKSVNATVVDLVAQALGQHRERLPMNLLSQLEGLKQTD